MSGLRLIFAGTPDFGIPCLEALANSKHTLAAIYTQPDRPAGRGRQLQTSAVKQWAQSQQIPVHQPLNFKDESDVKTLASIKADVMVVIAYGLILPISVLNSPRLGCINVHASLLPRWRGASPIQHAILHGDEIIGISVMQMDRGMDTGDVLNQVDTQIKPDDTAQTLHDRLAHLACEPLIATLDNIVMGEIHREKQSSDLATYAPKIKKEHAVINWYQPAQHIHQQIRAFNPWPIAFTQIGDQVIRVHEASVVAESSTKQPGCILSLDKSGMLVSTSSGALQIKTIQLAGGKVLSIADYLNSNRLKLHVNALFT